MGLRPLILLQGGVWILRENECKWYIPLQKTIGSHNALIRKHQAIFLSNETYLILPPKKN